MEVAPFMFINWLLCKLGPNEIPRICVLKHEIHNIINEAHKGVVGGHYQAYVIARKMLQAGLWWLTLFKDCWMMIKQCDICQRMCQPLWKDDIPLKLINPSLDF